MPHPNKVKGNVLEQNVAKDLRGKYPFSKTARYTSKLLDDCKIDITGVPFLIQCKAGYNVSRLRYDRLYLEMKELIKKNFSPNHPVHNLPYILINKLNGTRGKKEPELNQVTITYEFFLELIQHYKTDNAEV